jgi:hypothetical protein
MFKPGRFQAPDKLLAMLITVSRSGIMRSEPVQNAAVVQAPAAADSA